MGFGLVLGLVGRGVVGKQAINLARQEDGLHGMFEMMTGFFGM